MLDMEAGKEWSIPEMFSVPADVQGLATVHRHGEWYKQKLIPSGPQASGEPVISDQETA